MADKYTSQTISGYNASPPADDGTEVAANKVLWSSIKTKLADPIKTLAEAINTEVDAAIDALSPLFLGTSSKTTAYTIVSGDNGTLFRGDASGGAFTFTLLAAATAADGFRIAFIKTDSSANAITIDGNASETINGATTITLDAQYQCVALICDGSNWHIGTRTPEVVAFLAYNSTTDANVTGNNTTATVDFDTEVFDVGGDFASDTFTAPVTGRYQLSASVMLAETASSTLVEMNIVTSNRTYQFRDDNAADASQVSMQGAVLADMDAGDTVTVTVRVNGIGADTADVTGASSPSTFFSGYLVQ